MAQPAFFNQTSWTTILEAKAGEETVRLAALERLLTRYRPSILLEIRSRAPMQFRTPCTQEEAEELAHQFIHICLRRDFLKNIDPAKGRFRAFIKTCIVNFLRDLRREDLRKPEHVSLDETDPDGQRVIDPAGEPMAPEATLDGHWARQVLTLSLERLQQECIAARRGALFTALQPFLDGDAEGESYASIATRLGMSEGALRTATHRMRQRLGEIIKEEIRETVASDEALREELRYFLELLGRNPE